MFNNKTLNFKLFLISTVSVAILCFSVGFLLMNFKNSMMDSRQAQMASLTDSIYSLVQDFDEQYKRGDKTLAEAQAEARQLIENLKYNTNEYFFIFDKDAKMVAHGDNPSLVGKSYQDTKTSDGRAVFKNMADLIGGNNDVSETFYYAWPKHGTDEMVDKISVVKTYNDWGWVFGTGVYMDDIESDFAQLLITSGIILLVSIIIMTVINIPVIRSITKPIGRIKDVMWSIQNGDLTARTNIRTKNEMGELSKSIDNTIKSFQSLIRAVSQSSEKVVESATVMLEGSAKASASSEMQARETETLAAAMNEMSATVAEISQNATETYNAIEKVNSSADAGNTDMEHIASTIGALSHKIKDSSEIISTLDEDTKKVVHVLSQINDISEQTNLLALNAAIEAARAGESGRGFAVVADEVRKLAQRTQASTQEISEINERLVSAAEKAVNAMKESIDSAKDGEESAERSRERFRSIVVQVNDIKGLATQVAAATEQQSSVSEEINQNLNKIADSSQENLEVSTNVSSKSQSLSELSKTLEDSIKRFTV